MLSIPFFKRSVDTVIRRNVNAVTLFAGLAWCLPRVADAQAALAPAGALRGNLQISVAALADSIAAAGDTARAYALLDSALRRDKLDAPAWHRFGLLNWNMAKSKRNGAYVSDRRTIRLLQGADTALRLATQFAPDSARYWLALAQFNLTSGVSTMRFAAGGQADGALTAAVKVGDKPLMAIAADEVGMATWRRYEIVANRALTSDQQKIQLSSANNWSRDKARDYVNSMAKKVEPPTGDKDFNAALAKFRFALAADPTNLKISRHLFMALGERSRWEEMRDIAKSRSAAYPLDYQARLARGLASHRLGDEKNAQLAFDSAFALMDDEQRDRMNRFTRILRPRPTKESQGTVGDTTTFAKLPPAQKRGLESMYWLMSDPLTLTNENEYRLEFMSRVTFADFRWTNEDFNLLGADTDRGDVHVRYGPPDFEITVPGTSSGGEGGVTLVWGYNNGLTFFFDLPPGFGTARFAFSDRDNVEQMISSTPVSWANVASTRIIDTIPLRIARFRATGDSTDIVVAAQLPLDSLVRGLDLTRVPIDVDFRIFDSFVRIRGVESAQTTVRPDSTTTPDARSWTRRLGPGINVVRIEALQADSKRAARAMSRVNPEPTTGFGMSDILLGNAPKPKGTGAPARWSDIAIEPNNGTFAARSAIGIVWEMYELGPIDGQNKYRLAVTVERIGASGVGGVVARLMDGLGRSVGREQRGRDKLTIAFDRAVASARTLVEYLSLDLSDSPTGQYRLRVDITDLSTQKTTTRQTEFRIR